MKAVFQNPSAWKLQEPEYQRGKQFALAVMPQFCMRLRAFGNLFTETYGVQVDEQ